MHFMGFSPVCILTCVTRCDLSTKAFPQCSQENGFSPVWVRSWRVLFSAVPKRLSQKEHWYLEAAAAAAAAANGEKKQREDLGLTHLFKNSHSAAHK